MSKNLRKATEIRSTRDSTVGRVEIDSRGNSVWHWTATSSLDSTTHLLKSLDNDALELEPTRRVARMKAAAGKSSSPQRSGPGRKRHDDEPVRDAGGGFNPYDHSRRTR